MPLKEDVPKTPLIISSNAIGSSGGSTTGASVVVGAVVGVGVVVGIDGVAVAVVGPSVGGVTMGSATPPSLPERTTTRAMTTPTTMTIATKPTMNARLFFRFVATKTCGCRGRGLELNVFDT